MNHVTEVKLTQDGYGCWAVTVTKALEGALYVKTYPAGDMHNAFTLGKEAVTLTPADVATAEARGWRSAREMAQEAMERR